MSLSTYYAPMRNTASHDIHEKITSWFSSLFPYMVMKLRFAFRAAGAPLLILDTTKCGCITNSGHITNCGHTTKCDHTTNCGQTTYCGQITNCVHTTICGKHINQDICSSVIITWSACYNACAIISWFTIKISMGNRQNRMSCPPRRFVEEICQLREKKGGESGTKMQNRQGFA